jgi:hypothetical protein
MPAKTPSICYINNETQTMRGRQSTHHYRSQYQ